MAADPSPAEVPQWLKTLPLAPEYHPTPAEFHDPIAYILKIEKEASRYGICKIVPPLPAPPRRTAIANLKRSFAARSVGSEGPRKAPTFTTRLQQVGFCPRRPRPVQRSVWQSGEYYTLEQFEAKAKQFERAQLKKTGKKAFLPLEMESLFWKACADKPISVEYANDMPGSGFAPLGAGKNRLEEDSGNVGDTLWNMRAVSRAKGSLLRFMKEEIPGVTSPMVYVAMIFSWFAWHVEDHDLHSLNYLHMGAGKTWYGVPRDARLAFEEVVRVHGYAEEMNPLVTFTTLGEKTTVISPEVLMDAGIPCCRLVQNAGEFVVTFPGSYHSGFSHGFNCGEAANIATPEWLRVAKEAAIRRASTNYPPMVSHYQLLYALALSLCSRVPNNCSPEPRSSRLKDKMRGEGEIMVKEIFIESVIKNNNLLSVLLDEGSCIILPKNTSYSPCSSVPTRTQVKIKPRLSLGFQSQQLSMEALPSDAVMLERSEGMRHFNGSCSVEEHPSTVSQGKKLYSSNAKVVADSFCSSTPELQSLLCPNGDASQGNGLLDQGLLSCVTCGILSFACVAVIQLREATARYLMSSDFNVFNGHIADSAEKRDADNISNWWASDHHMVSGSGQAPITAGSLVSTSFSIKASDQCEQIFSKTTRKGISALDLLASAYGVSDSEEEALNEMSASADENDLVGSSLKCKTNPKLTSTSNDLSSSTAPFETERQLDRNECKQAYTGISRIPFARLDAGGEVSVQNSCNIDDLSNLNGATSPKYVDTCQVRIECNRQVDAEGAALRCLKYDSEMPASSVVGKTDSKLLPMYSGDEEANGRFQLTGTASISTNDIETENPGSNSGDFSRQPDTCVDSPAITGSTYLRNYRSSIKESAMSDMLKYDKEFSRMHVFCLEHALEVEKQLQPVGGVDVMLLCHPEYPKLEEEAKLMAEELGIDHEWKEICFREATEEDKERIRTALEDEEAIPMNSDWAVKMGINLYYSASQSKSPLYSKQMPYNAIIYKAFGRESPANSPMKPKGPTGRLGRQKKIVVAGRWCGKVWMSNQVHPYLAHINEHQEHEYGNKSHPVPVQKTRVKPNIQCIKRRERSNRDLSIGSTPSTKKSGRKRKRPSGKSRTQKQRYTQLDRTDISEDVPEISSSSKCRKGVCRSLIKNLSKAKCQENCSQHDVKLKNGAEDAPRTRLRRQQPKLEGIEMKISKKLTSNRKARKAQTKDLYGKDEDDDEEEEYSCDLEGCSMSFSTKHDLALHKRNICPLEGCGKKFFSHKYLLQHRKVHLDDRPLKCPWKGCKMTFKWPWARTEHIRVHTGARPYVCKEAGCGQTFRFVSDFSRHKRKTGHSAKKICK